jgi:hypothetical protein
MKTFYFAKCDKCKEVRYIFCTNPSVTAFFFSDKDEEIQGWLSKHNGCELTLGWRDDHLDSLWDEGYTSKDLNDTL